MFIFRDSNNNLKKTNKTCVHKKSNLFQSQFTEREILQICIVGKSIPETSA